MELRPGYKQTEVGVIPEDWDVSTVGREFSVQLGKMLDAERNFGIPKPYLGNRAVQWARIDLSDLSTVPMSQQDLQKFRLAKGDLLVCEGGEVGRAAIWDAPINECYYQKALHRLRPLRGFEPRLMVAILRQWSERGVFANYITQTSIAHLPREKFIEIPIPRPSLPEQRAIATVLADLDALLEGLTRLIAKKRDLKQAAMQQLLIGHTRLPGFREEWEVRRVDEMGEVLAGKALAAHAPGTLRSYLRTKNVLDGQIDVDDVLEMPMTDVEFERFRILEGDVLLNEGQSLELVGRCSMYRGELTRQCAMQNQLLRFRARQGTSPGFAEQLFRWYQRTGVFASIATQTTSVAHLGTTRFSGLRVMCPQDLAEQAAIAAVLLDMDAELAALEARREKTRALKQAMVQALLSGRTRLVVPAVMERRKDSEQTDGRRANIHFKRSVLAAEIIDRLHNEPTFGHVKFEKMIFLVEQLCDVDTGSAYHRDAAGPYDNRAIRSIDSQLRKQKWFDAQRIEGRFRYEPMANRGKHKEYFERYFGGIGTTFDTVIETFRTFTTERCEIVATLFAAWRDLVQQNGPVSDDVIVNEVLNNWHESKKRIPEERWRKALSWMRDRGFVPHKATGA